MPALGWAHGCDITTRKGGIPFLTFFKCDPDIEFPVDTGEDSPWTDLDNWRFAICQLHLFVTGELLGQKPKGTFTKKRLGSCSPESTVAGSKTITFQDFNADNDTLLDFDFWNGVKANQKFFQLGWVTCEDLVYQTTNNWDLEIDEVSEQDSEQGLSFKDGSISINQFDMITPIKVAGIYDLLKNLSTAECYG